MKDIPTALLPLIFKYQNPPQTGEAVLPGQSPLEACWVEVNNDLVALDQRLGVSVCQSFYKELQVFRGSNRRPFVTRQYVVDSLKAAAPEVARKASNLTTYADCWKLTKMISEFEGRR